MVISVQIYKITTMNKSVQYIIVTTHTRCKSYGPVSSSFSDYSKTFLNTVLLQQPQWRMFNRKSVPLAYKSSDVQANVVIYELSTSPRRQYVLSTTHNLSNWFCGFIHKPLACYHFVRWQRWHFNKGGAASLGRLIMCYRYAIFGMLAVMWGISCLGHIVPVCMVVSCGI